MAISPQRTTSTWAGATASRSPGHVLTRSTGRLRAEKIAHDRDAASAGPEPAHRSTPRTVRRDHLTASDGEPDQQDTEPGLVQGHGRPRGVPHVQRAQAAHGHALHAPLALFGPIVPEVTALTAEAASFSGCTSLTRAQSGPGVDVLGPVDVGVHRAVVGADHGVLLRAGASSPAQVAIDTRVSRVHEDHASPSFFHFGDEDVRELCPASVADRFIQAGFRGRPVRR